MAGGAAIVGKVLAEMGTTAPATPKMVAAELSGGGYRADEK